MLAQTVRLSVVMFGGAWLLSVGASYIWFFVLGGVAMSAFGLVHRSHGPRHLLGHGTARRPHTR